MRLRSLATLALAAAAALSAACADAPPVAPEPGAGGSAPALLEALPRPLTAAERQAVAAGTAFSLGLFREVSRARPDANVFVSPLSAAVALAMTAQGAAGETELAMRRTLGFADRSLEEMGAGYRELLALLVRLDTSVTLRSANAIWYRSGFPFEASFVDATRRLFDADVRAADFVDVRGTLAAINGWARERTNGRIETVLDDISDDHVMFLLNALYFKGAWRDRFDARRTTTEPFATSRGGTAPVPLMRRDGEAAWARGDGFQAVDLPYGNAAFSMTVLLPDSGRTADALAASLTPEAWTTTIQRLQPAVVDLALPRFRFSTEHLLNAPLTTLGMGAIFAGADFSRMSPARLEVDFVKQNAFVEVNEEGTEAAAVTTIGIRVVSAPARVTMRVDRPFVFAIRERLTGAVLFVGKVNEIQ